VPIDRFTDGTALLRAGVYALLWRGLIVYVGQSKCLLARVAAHRSNMGRKGPAPAWAPPSMRRMQFDEFQYLTCAPDDLDDIEVEMINRYRPRYNVHHKSPSDVPMLSPVDLEFDGQTFVRLNVAPAAQGLVRRC
jgi:excinuclease UvrABC nuclease subunit